MNTGLIAKTTIAIDAPVARVWKALITPELVKQYFFGVAPETDWSVGSAIVWKGEWQGKKFEDKGEMLQAEENRVLQFTHFSPLSGKPDVPENYHTITIELGEDGERTAVILSQDNNATDVEREHSEKNWRAVLEGLKKVAEQE